VDSAVENPNEVVAQIEAGKAKYLAVASAERLKGAPNVPTFKERGFDFEWEQMRGVVGPADMGADALKWWEEALRKVSDSKKWREQYIERNLLTPVFWTGDQANKYLDGLREKYTKAFTDLGALKK
jgi:putative tricarboxylic transport membrane protein